jgi:hypothetical protein
MICFFECWYVFVIPKFDDIDLYHSLEVVCYDNPARACFCSMPRNSFVVACVVVDRAPKNGARASPELFVLFARARASLGSSPTQTSP